MKRCYFPNTSYHSLTRRRCFNRNIVDTLLRDDCILSKLPWNHWQVIKIRELPKHCWMPKLLWLFCIYWNVMICQQNVPEACILPKLPWIKKIKAVIFLDIYDMFTKRVFTKTTVGTIYETSICYQNHQEFCLLNNETWWFANISSVFSYNETTVFY